MTFPPLPAHQSGHDTRRALPGATARFLEVFRREKVVSSSNEVSCFDLILVWSFTGNILSLPNNSTFAVED